MNTTDPYTHDRQACPDCADQRQRWGDHAHCGRTHDFRVGQLVTVGKASTPWTVAWTAESIVKITREVPATYFGTRNHYRSFGAGARRPITDLHLVEPPNE